MSWRLQKPRGARTNEEGAERRKKEEKEERAGARRKPEEKRKKKGKSRELPEREPQKGKARAAWKSCAKEKGGSDAIFNDKTVRRGSCAGTRARARERSLFFSLTGVSGARRKTGTFGRKQADFFHGASKLSS